MGRETAMDWRAVMEVHGNEVLDLWEEKVIEGDQAQQFMDLETTMGCESRGLGGILDFIREDPIEVTIYPASLARRPSLPAVPEEFKVLPQLPVSLAQLPLLSCT